MATSLSQVIILAGLIIMSGNSHSTERELVEGQDGQMPAATTSLDPGDHFYDISKLNLDNVKIDLKYATSNNFINRNMYGPVGLNRAFIHKRCGAQLMMAAKLLKKKRPDLKLVVLDALRPLSAQKEMWKAALDKYKTEEEAGKYVSKVDLNRKPGETPQQYSMHNLGLAIDVQLENANHNPIDMGTKFDEFSEKSGISSEVEKTLTAEQTSNRDLLRSIMTGPGFKTYSKEWWHFNCFDRTNKGKNGPPTPKLMLKDRATFPLVE